MKENFALWKIFGNWVCIVHCNVVFPYSLKAETGSGYPGNCNQVPGS